MGLKVLFSAPRSRWDEWRTPLTDAFSAEGLEVDLATDHPPEDVDYIVYAPNGFLSDFTPYQRCRAVFSLWAGVEAIVGNETLTMPLTRMVDPGLERGMVEYVAGHVLRHHLGIDRFLGTPQGEWEPVVPPLASDRKITVLGLGALGAACATTLAGLGFDVTGWARTQKDLPDVRCLGGAETLDQALTGAEGVVLLLPLTAETENLLDARRLALLADGAFVVNPGRGPLIDDDALLAALDSGVLSHATLDVFREEPLPKPHPFWTNPKVTVTPHIASETRPSSAAKVVAENLRRAEAGEPLLYLVDRTLGY
ncbi:2-hydroxyacid dehydrogenase [Pelagovum pacificum]|uniref:Glyoxylate/hydroxypyruvate reductase A n=1 Tax=Pelagovum pacificum TaxID=2588711 RepID=A0A5C5G9K6_9RHOB|nr:glyoxylate/hydroxypyruvate reductase A [Pelagovum pacificum]QQA42354.1 glyoxylate/hydroxypyruvate reductase A [Pelagovum pacificum]TNY31438.1 glyoxylate/hydroxypyruvate reductase A [Pelagovum pacificum]